MKGKACARGVTLSEVMVVMATIGVIFMMMSGLIRIMHSFSKEKIVLESQRDVEVALYQVVRDIRNAAWIQEIAPGGRRIVLRTYNFPQGANINPYDVNTGGVNANVFYASARLRTLTYQLVTNGGNTFLERILVESPAGGGATLDTKRFLKNMLDSSQVVFTSDDDPGAIQTVRVDFNVRSREYNIPPRLYRETIMIRAGG